MMARRKRFLSVLLALLLCVSLFPFPAASAEEATEDAFAADPVIDELVLDDGTTEPQTPASEPNTVIDVLIEDEEDSGDEAPSTEPMSDTAMVGETPLEEGSFDAADAGEIKADGSCGTNIKWKYDAATCILEIYPENAGQDAIMDGTTHEWTKWYKTDIQKVVIKDGVKNIGNDAFSGCTALKSVEFHNGSGKFDRIDIRAFYGCTGLTNIEIPDTVSTLDNMAFYGCTGLTSVTIPASVSIFGNGVFQGCSSLKTATLSEGVKSIGSASFKDCLGLTDVTIPTTLTAIGSQAFYSCTGLQSIDLDSVTIIGEEAFYHCSGLTALKIPQNVDTIDIRAFSGCTGLTSVKIPANVKIIGIGAFQDCSGLTTLTITSGVENIGSSAFQGCSRLSTLTIPGSVSNIGSGAFQDCSGLTTVTIKGDAHPIIGDSAFKDCSGMTKVTIQEGVTTIGNDAFNGCCDLQSVKIPSSVTSIGDRAFYQCIGLATLTIQVGGAYKSIGSSAFAGCTGLTKVTIPENVDIIGKEAFQGCTGLTTVKLLEDEYGNGVTTIGDSAFEDCYGMIKITIPDSVTTIGNDAFRECGSLQSVDIPDNITVIGKGTFYDCSGLQSVDIPDYVTTIGEEAFFGCSSLTMLTLPERLKSIGSKAFSECTGLTSIEIPEKVTTIGSKAFSESGLQTATFTGNAPTFSSDCFNEVTATCYYRSTWSKSVLKNYGGTLTWIPYEPEKFIVSYDANGGSGAPEYQTQNTGGKLTLSTTEPTRTGYSFLGWSKDALATKAQYSPGGEYEDTTGDISVILYAVWKIDTYTVNYNPNGGDMGSAPKEQKKTYGVDLTLSKDKPTRAATGEVQYTIKLEPNGGNVDTPSVTATSQTSYTFTGWNTAANNSGTPYAPEGTYKENVGVTLYAQWKEETTTNPNPVMLPIPTRSGYGFMGWAENSTDTSGFFSYTPTGNVTLYATWRADTYLVTYEANGGISTSVPDPQTKTRGTVLTLSSGEPSRTSTIEATYTVTLDANGGSVSPTSKTSKRQTTYTFQNWNTKPDGTGTTYFPGTSYTTDASVILFAQWNSNTTTESVLLPTPTRSGYAFQGWAESSTATYGVIGTYVPTGNVTLYATWKADNEYTVSYNPNGGSGAPEAQTKTKGIPLKLSSTVPTRGDKPETGYTVTLDANGGSVSTHSLTAARKSSFAFKNWNTSLDGSGTSYSPGASYTADASATLYAQWTSTTTTEAVTLPTPTRTNYEFQGWATSASATSGVKGSYTPSGNVTLYATWKEQGTPGQYVLRQDEDGVFRVYKDGVFSPKTGFIEYNGSLFYVRNGVLDTTANGLKLDPDHQTVWYFCSNGMAQTQYTGLAEYDGEWFYLSDGVLDTTRTGIVTYNGGRFMIAAGRILRESTGLIQDPNTGLWYYVAAGQVADYTGLALYDGEWFYVINGKLAENYTGWVKYNGKEFYVVNGMVVE